MIYYKHPIDRDISDIMEQMDNILKKSTINIFDYQKKTINWMYDKEINPILINYNLDNELLIGKDIIFCTNSSKILY